MEKLAVIILNWNQTKQTISLINNFLAIETDLDITFIIVDNNSQENEKKMLIDFSNDKGFMIIEESNYNSIKDNKKFTFMLKENYGYAKGNNYGLKLAEKFNYKYSLICNNDIILEQEIILDLLDQFKKDDKVALIGPKIVGLNGETQGPYEKPGFFKELAFPYLLPLVPRKITNRFFSSNESFYPYRIMGCFMLAKTNVMKEIGYFDENTFLYAEELIIAEKLTKKGYKTLYYPKVYVKHIHGFSTNDLGNEKKFLLNLKSDLYYFEKYRNFGSISLFLISVARKGSFYIWHPLILRLKKFIKGS